MFSRTHSLLFGGILSLSIVAQAAERPIVAVFDIEDRSGTLNAKTRDQLTDYLGSLLARRGFQVVPRSQLRERLTEAKKGSYKACFDESCQIEVGKELAAQKSLATQVLKLGSTCKVTVNLYDLKRAASDGAGKGSGKCDEDGVVLSLEQAVEDLFSREAEARRPAEDAVREKAEEEKARDEALARAEYVQQPESNLCWLRCPLGQTWNGSSCQGEMSKMTWAYALKACPAGYRLPTRQEFVDLLGGCSGGVRGGHFGCCASCEKSAHCSSMFGEDRGLYWSSSSGAGNASNAWGIDFYYGRVNSGDKDYCGLVNIVGKDYTHNVRCVRPGP